MKATLRWLASNSPLMVLALILAILAWMGAVEQSDPTREDVYSQAISVTLSDPPEGMIIVGELEESVRFTVRAPESVWSAVKDQDFTASVNLVDLNAGTHQVPIEWALSKHPSQIVQVEPDYVTVELEPKAEQTVDVRIQTEGEPTLGYIMRMAVVTPSQIAVSGPSTYVAQVDHAVTQISVRNASADVRGEYRLQALDSEGREVDHVTLALERVAVRIPVELSVYYRPLVVRVILEGQFASGHRITKVSVDPPSVTVFGAPGVIAALPGFIETEPVDLEGAQSNVIAQPALDVPLDVSIILDKQPVVSVSIEPILSSLTMVITPEIQGLDPGFTFTISPETIEVILSGSMSQLETLGDAEVRIVLNLFELPAETYQIEPEIIAPEGVMAQSVNPATVQVEISIAPSVMLDEESEVSE